MVHVIHGIIYIICVHRTQSPYTRTHTFLRNRDFLKSILCPLGSFCINSKPNTHTQFNCLNTHLDQSSTLRVARFFCCQTKSYSEILSQNHMIQIVTRSEREFQTTNLSLQFTQLTFPLT